MSGRQPTFVERLTRADPQSLVGAEDIPLVHLQLLAEMIDDRSAHQLGIVRRSSDAWLPSPESRHRTILIFVNANALSQVRIVAEECQDLMSIIDRLATLSAFLDHACITGECDWLILRGIFYDESSACRSERAGLVAGPVSARFAVATDYADAARAGELVGRSLANGQDRNDFDYCGYLTLAEFQRS